MPSQPDSAICPHAARSKPGDFSRNGRTRSIPPRLAKDAAESRSRRSSSSVSESSAELARAAATDMIWPPCSRARTARVMTNMRKRLLNGFWPRGVASFLSRSCTGNQAGCRMALPHGCSLSAASGHWARQWQFAWASTANAMDGRSAAASMPPHKTTNSAEEDRQWQDSSRARSQS